MNEKIFTSNGIPITYKFRKAKQDRKHLTVIFSGFRKKQTYDFDGAAIQGLRGAILWIQDYFNDDFSYYLYSKNQDLTDTVYSLIASKMESMGLEKIHVTLAGFSKGGSAALYYGAKYGFNNILSTVPQFKIGSYLSQNMPAVLDSMLEAHSERISQLDELLPSTLESDRQLSKNIYLFTSPADDQFKTEVLPHLHLFEKYHNFNYIETDSPLVRQHDRVTWYNVPLILSIFYALAEGAAPRFGSVRNGVNNFGSSKIQPNLESVRIRKEHVFATKTPRMVRDRFHIEGHSFAKGFPAHKHGEVTSRLMLNGTSETISAKLGTAKDASLSDSYFENEPCDYNFASFTTLGNEGIDLSDIAYGTYDILVHSKHSGQEFEAAVKAHRSTYQRTICGTSVYEISVNEAGAQLSKRSLLNRADYGSYLSLEKCWAKDSMLHVQGYFIIPGQPTPGWRDISYHLILNSSTQLESPIIIPLPNANRSNAGSIINDQWNDYSKSYFATSKYEGIDLDGLRRGNYKLSISAVTKNLVVTKDLNLEIEVQESFTTDKNQLTVGVIGSCVTRDLFNSKLSPGWKSRYAFHGGQYQMSLVSLLAEPVSRAQVDLGGMDEHSRIATERDFDKSYLSELRAEQPDVIMLDFYSDARFGCIQMGNSYITDNAWKLGTSNHYPSLAKNSRYSRQSAPEAFLSLFRQATINFKIFAEKYLPNTTIIVNSARGVKGYYDQYEFKKFSNQISFNQFWETLDKIFLEIFSCSNLKIDQTNILSAKDHPWGPANVHYEPSYYSRTHSELIALLPHTTLIKFTELK
ncbi:accessory Sec system protein Asp2 [Arthrobacter sp. MYb227]|uniref:accessory Sec system protein Asp2 n=1 Tax=Arthrobacter sp. MYb227 TaxID=1848601 RepID=UPI0015E272B8|nr:accessory Sec system protein Asp2 [Arthrobacter sp. MYb227]